MSQQDIHYSSTFALAIKAGLDINTARTIAWSDQFTDELTKPELHGLRTQCGTKDDWYDRTVQADVLVPFHFLPGDKPEVHPWMVTQYSRIVKRVIDEAVKSKNLFRIGIALHSLQDSFSHQGWTGWQEKFNACYWFKIIPIPTPNVGHTDKGLDPDIVDCIWTDPRSGEKINNIVRVKDSLRHSYTALCQFSGLDLFGWNSIAKQLHPFYQFKGIGAYDKRKQWLSDWCGGIDKYSKIEEGMKHNYKADFVKAAREQLSLVTSLVAELPAVKE